MRNPNIDKACNITRLRNAVTESLRELELHPDDSVVDIFNESLILWGTGLYMDGHYNIETDNN